MILSLQKCNIMLIYPTDDMKSMVEFMVVYVVTMYVVVVGQVWWFGVMDLLSLLATVIFPRRPANSHAVQRSVNERLRLKYATTLPMKSLVN